MAAVALQHGARLRRFLGRRLRNRADARDLAQEVYLRLLRLERHEEIRAPEAYLLTIARHLLHEHAMQQAAAPRSVDLADLAASYEATDDDLSAQAERHQRLKVLENALARLSPKSHAVLVLHRRDGFSLEEIGTQLGISRNTAKKHLAKALSHCRQRLERLK